MTPHLHMYLVAATPHSLVRTCWCNKLCIYLSSRQCRLSSCTLVSLLPVQLSGLEKPLLSLTTGTILAPTNDAFESLSQSLNMSDAAIEQIMAPETLFTVGASCMHTRVCMWE